MIRSLLYFAALALAAPALAQTVTVTTPNTVNPSGQSTAVQKTFIVNQDGSIATIGGTSGTVTTPSDRVTTVQGTSANGAPATGNPNAIAGTDSGGVTRTVRTDANGTLQFAGTVQGNTAAGATDSGNPNKIGGVGSNTSPAAVANGQRVNAWFSLNGAQVVTGLAQSAYSAGNGSASPGGMLDPTGAQRPLSTGGLVTNGTGEWQFMRAATAADATTGTGLLGAGILGQYLATPSIYTTGQFGTLLMNSRGAIAIGHAGSTATGANVPTGIQMSQGLDGSSRPLATAGFLYDGTNFRIALGDTVGAFVKEQARTQYFAEAITPLAANAGFLGLARDAGVANPTPWNIFTCVYRSDQAGASFSLAIQFSDDGTSWQPSIINATPNANSPITLTAPVVARYYRCVVTNGTTAQTAVYMRTKFGI